MLPGCGVDVTDRPFAAGSRGEVDSERSREAYRQLWPGGDNSPAPGDVAFEVGAGGVAVCGTDTDCVYVEALYVPRDERGRGYARRLLSAACGYAASLGRSIVRTDTWSDDRTAVHPLLACGFVRDPVNNDPPSIKLFLRFDWTRASRTALSREYPATGAVWGWLASHGVERVATSGPSGKRVAPRGERVEWVPSSEAARDAIGTLAARWGCSRGVAIDEALLRAVAQAPTA